MHFAAVVARLAEKYGQRSWLSSGRPLDELIATILSQHTSDANSARAYASLRAAYSDWRDAMNAPTRTLADAIRAGGLAEIKAPRIQAVLHRIESTAGELSLDWLSELPMANAREWLTSLPGVGPKTASCVLLFSLGQPAMPVDTHVFRVASRLGILPDSISPALAHQPLEAMIGPDRDATYAIHLNLIAHGRATCHARNPACHRCVLADLCPSAACFLPAAN